MFIEYPNFSAEIHFTVGISGSVAITKVKEFWISSLDECDAVKVDIMESGAVEVLDCIGVDLDKQGSFSVKILGEAKFDESPDYELLELSPVLN